ncbi:MAG: PEP-CTERM sorting domain-containing protein, partial [Myxococcota bacterium]
LVLLALALGAGAGDPQSPRGPAGAPTEVPPLDVRPVPSVDRPDPYWRMPEEETLPERLRRREEPTPGRLADAAPLERHARPSIVPPLATGPAAPSGPGPRPASEALQLARTWRPAAEPPAPRTSGATPATGLVAPRVVAAADLPSDLPSPGPRSATPAQDEPFALAPGGVAATGALPVRSVPAPPPLQEEAETPSLFVDDTPAGIDAPSLLGLPSSERKPFVRPPFVRPPIVEPPGRSGSAPGQQLKIANADDRLRGGGAPDTPRTRVVPEPGTLLLVGGGLTLLARCARRRQGRPARAVTRSAKPAGAAPPCERTAPRCAASPRP